MNPVSAAIALRRDQAGHARRFHAGQARHAPNNLLPQRCHLRLARIDRPRRHHPHCCEMVWIEAQRYMQEPIQTLPQQTRTFQQHHCDRQLNHHQVCTQPAPQGTRGSTIAGGQAIAHLLERKPQDRCPRQQQCRRQHVHASKQYGVRIHVHAFQERHIRSHVLRHQTCQQAHEQCGHAQAHRSAHQCQQHSFHHELPHQPPLRRPQRAPHGNFTSPALRTHQHQARHIHARDHQQQAGGAQQRQQNRPNFADENFRQRNHLSSQFPAGGRVLLLNLLGDRRHLGLRRLRTHPIAQSSDSKEVIEIARALVRRQCVDRNPELRVSAERKRERARQNSDDRVRLVIERNRLAHDIAARAESVQPGSVAHQRYIRPAQPVLARIEVAPQRWLHFQRPEESPAHTRARHRFRSLVRAQQVTGSAIHVQ